MSLQMMPSRLKNYRRLTLQYRQKIVDVYKPIVFVNEKTLETGNLKRRPLTDNEELIK